MIDNLKFTAKIVPPILRQELIAGVADITETTTVIFRGDCCTLSEKTIIVDIADTQTNRDAILSVISNHDFNTAYAQYMKSLNQKYNIGKIYREVPPDSLFGEQGDVTWYIDPTSGNICLKLKDPDSGVVKTVDFGVQPSV